MIPLLSRRRKKYKLYYYVLILFRISIMSEIAPKNVAVIIAITSTYVRSEYSSFFTSVKISAKVPAFRNRLVRAGTRVEVGIRRANYTFGYFVVLPACGLRNDRLFINDLSLGTSWTITRGSSEVPRSNLAIRSPRFVDPLPVCRGALTFRLTISRGSRSPLFKSLRLGNRAASSAKRFTT